MTTTDRPEVIVLGRDRTGVIAESDNFRYYLTECCGASAKGLEDCIGCRVCYCEIDPALGDVPDMGTVLVKVKPERGGIRDDIVGGWWVFAKREIDFVEVFGDGIPWSQWAARAGIKRAV